MKKTSSLMGVYFDSIENIFDDKQLKILDLNLIINWSVSPFNIILYWMMINLKLFYVDCLELNFNKLFKVILIF